MTTGQSWVSPSSRLIWNTRYCDVVADAPGAVGAEVATGPCAPWPRSRRPARPGARTRPSGVRPFSSTRLRRYTGRRATVASGMRRLVDRPCGPSYRHVHAFTKSGATPHLVGSSQRLRHPGAPAALADGCDRCRSLSPMRCTPRWPRRPPCCGGLRLSTSSVLARATPTPRAGVDHLARHVRPGLGSASGSVAPSAGTSGRSSPSTCSAPSSTCPSWPSAPSTCSAGGAGAT